MLSLALLIAHWALHQEPVSIRGGSVVGVQMAYAEYTGTCQSQDYTFEDGGVFCTRNNRRYRLVSRWYSTGKQYEDGSFGFTVTRGSGFVPCYRLVVHGVDGISYRREDVQVLEGLR